MRLIQGMVVGAVVAALAIYMTMMSVAGDMMFVERVSPYSYEETIAKVKQSYLDNGWQVLSVKDSNEGFVKKGKASVGKITNMKVCADEIAYELLKNDANKHIITMMPCGVGIYEKGGKVYVATMNVGMMKGMMSPEVETIMGRVAADTDKVMQVLAKR
ncbi:MAG: DUF302 domain-containing protein [Campylobacterales bacterium]|nr:DUF302 domain-containing protein [Campylobacterales bacterium]